MPRKKANRKEQREKPIHAQRLPKARLATGGKALSAKQETEWFLFDAKGEVLGRLATKIAVILQGKHKADFVPYREMADNVVVVNAAKVQVTGKKEKQKVYTFYSGYPGGLKKVKMAQMRAKKPEFLIWHAVAGMLPKNKLAKLRLKKLHIFAGNEHAYQDKFREGTRVTRD